MSALEKLAAMVGLDGQDRFPWARLMCPGLHSPQCYCKGRGYFPNTDVHAEDVLDWLSKQKVPYTVTANWSPNASRMMTVVRIDNDWAVENAKVLNAILDGVLAWAEKEKP